MSRIKGFLIILATVFSLATTLHAETYYISLSGSDSAIGSSAQPWLTLQHAADTVIAGDTVRIRSGTYAGFRAKSSGTAALPIIFKADTGASVIVNSVSLDGKKGSIIEIEEHDWWVIEGCEVTGAPKNAGIDIRVADHVTIRNCYCHHNRKWGIFTAFAEYFTAEYNQCSYSTEEHGIYHSNSGDNAVIRYNTCHHNSGCGIQINADPSMGGDGISSNCVVTHNILHENGSLGGSAINLASVRDSLFANNLIYNNHAGGIAAWDDAQGNQWGSKNNKYYNNTVHMPTDGRWAINLKNGSIGCEVFNNILIHQNSSRGGLEIDTSSLMGFSSDYNILTRISVDETTISLSAWQSTYSQDSQSFSQTAAQTFVSPSSDYHLLCTALAIDGGATLPEIIVDLDGNTRPQDAGYDIGAYEWVSAPKATIQANGSNGPVTVSSGTPVSITISLNPGDKAGQNADWWVAESAPDGWHYYDVIGGSWSFLPGLSVTYQGPLFNFTSFGVLNTSGLPVGSYTFYFGVDMNMNASLDFDQLYYDSVVVNVTQVIKTADHVKVFGEKGIIKIEH